MVAMIDTAVGMRRNGAIITPCVADMEEAEMFVTPHYLRYTDRTGVRAERSHRRPLPSGHGPANSAGSCHPSSVLFHGQGIGIGANR